MGKSLIITDGRAAPVTDPATSEVLDLHAFVHRAYGGQLLTQLGRFASVRLITHSPEYLPRRWLLEVLLRLLTRGRCEIEGVDGSVRAVTLGRLIAGAVGLLRDARPQLRLYRATNQQVAALERGGVTTAPSCRLMPDRAPYYLKTDLWLGTAAGGSVGHMAGVVNNLGRSGPLPRVWALSANPLLDDRVAFALMQPPQRFWDYRESPALAFNGDVMRTIGEAAAMDPPGWIYQRYSLHNFAGAWAARRFGVPFVLEYNGSEVWIGKHWGRGLRYPKLAERIERLNLQEADLVVVVSEASRSELTERGFDPQKILVNPNGVDTDRYTPQIDSTRLRRRLGLDGALVIGFIGTFGDWHGADVLVEAFAQLRRAQGLTTKVRLLLIGDGKTRRECERRARELGIADEVVFAGLVPQIEGPGWLAACDVLVAPHVPNPDGSAFFGSPTKLFEYMAMGRPIVASRLGQMAELLVHGQTGWLVDPGRAPALAEGLRTVISEPELGARMGRQARREAVESHTWAAHTRRIVEQVRARCA
jgi:glycosyltransferase involved in cell wall biosynthesis